MLELFKVEKKLEIKIIFVDESGLMNGKDNYKYVKKQEEEKKKGKKILHVNWMTKIHCFGKLQKKK